MEHELKILQKYFSPVWVGIKTFELRKIDRNFRIYDTLRLREWGPISGYSGKEITVKIIYVLEDVEGLEKGYAILGIK